MKTDKIINTLINVMKILFYSATIISMIHVVLMSVNTVCIYISVMMEG